MREYDVRKTQFTVSDFLSWQRDGTLDINPPFQRRSVWKPDAKSYFLDTVVKGLPAPIIYIRQSIDLKSQKTIREIVDGQQRLRTLFSYVDSNLLKDYNEKRDSFVVKKVHNKDLAGKSFSQLSSNFQQRILAYEFSTHVLPINIEDREVLEMFARLNATGVKLTHQELRNAEYFGEFKTLMYELAFEQLDRWRMWKIFTDDQISRMKEVEMTSDLALNMISGHTGKTQKKLNDLYDKYDDDFPEKIELARRFRLTLDEIDNQIGNIMTKTIYSSEVFFFTLFAFVYNELFGLASPLLDKITAKKLKKDSRERLLKASHNIESENVDKNILDAVQRASSDFGRRKTRFDYLKEIYNA